MELGPPTEWVMVHGATASAERGIGADRFLDGQESRSCLVSSSRRASSVISANGIAGCAEIDSLWGVEPPQCPMIGERLARYFEIPGIAMLVLHHEFAATVAPGPPGPPSDLR